MTKEQWSTCIQDARALQRYAKKSDKYVDYMADALTETLKGLSKRREVDQTNKEDLQDLVLKIGNYSIQKNHEPSRVNLTAEYDELCDILESEGLINGIQG